ncbi:hypothetical protein ACFRQM_32960 [Streptomyces sp. NPDC056831]|uniref:hypothetical protein n=1 Tax=Streptomyces sp. NPDC056831 TaxID=3345954 RepID=UPI0036C31A94
MTPADELRTAAQMLRAHATAAAKDTGSTTWHTAHHFPEQPDAEFTALCATGGRPLLKGGGGRGRPPLYVHALVGSYIALMDPSVGLAVTEWLETTAGYYAPGPTHPTHMVHALAVARQILGTSSRAAAALCDMMFEDGRQCAKPDGHRPPGSEDPHVPEHLPSVAEVPETETLTPAERQFLTFTLDHAADEMASRDGFTDEDEAALTRFRRMADTTSTVAEEQRASIAAQIGAAKSAANTLLVSLAESVEDRREHEHPEREDWYCLNIVGYMGERMAPVLRRLLDAEDEALRLRARVAELEASQTAALTPHVLYADSPHCQADGALWPCPTVTTLALAAAPAEEPHDSPLHHEYALGRDLSSSMTADEWNRRYPVGTPVLAYPGTRDNEPLDTVTRTPAWTLGHGAAVVSVEGAGGGICLTHVDPIGGAS